MKTVLKLDLVAVIVHPDNPKVLISAIADKIADLRRPFPFSHGTIVHFAIAERR